jgi:methylated-DNA-[protein]-cysteine S-methyltransferase
MVPDSIGPMPERRASFDSLDTPIGRLWLAGTDAGLRLITRADDPAAMLGELSRRGYEAVPEGTLLDDVKSWLEAYFAGSRIPPTMPLDTGAMTAFDAAVYRAAIEIPYGETASYGEVAAMAGSPRAARAVGGAMSRCPLFPVVPCHRVIHADGSIAGWGLDPWVKRWLLDLEAH